MAWDCEAYGPDGAAVGALCFFAPELGERTCADEDECHTRMAVERQRVFQRINELAAEGNPDMVALAEDVTHPEQLLGGDEP